MKTQLTYKQATELIDVGAPRGKATGRGYFADVAGYYSTFTLANLLETLPKKIDYEGYNSELTMQWNCTLQKWDVGYCYNMGFWRETIFSSEELIDALYHLTWWYYKKFKNNEN